LSDSSTCHGKIPNVDGVYFTSLQHMSRKSLFSFFCSIFLFIVIKTSIKIMLKREKKKNGLPQFFARSYFYNVKKERASYFVDIFLCIQKSSKLYKCKKKIRQKGEKIKQVFLVVVD